MEKQLTCFKCGKVDRSEWFQTCECKEPDFRDASYEDYLDYKEAQKKAHMLGRSYVEELKIAVNLLNQIQFSNDSECPICEGIDFGFRNDVNNHTDGCPLGLFLINNKEMIE